MQLTIIGDSGDSSRVKEDEVGTTNAEPGGKGRVKGERLALTSDRDQVGWL